MSVDPSSGRLRCTTTDTSFGPDFGSAERASDFLAFIGYYPADWRERRSFSFGESDPRDLAAEALAEAVRKFERREAARCPYSDHELAERAARAAGYAASPRRVRWAAVQDVFGTGSVWSIDICRRFGLDPHEEVGIVPEEGGGS
jgi:hypothetical protein